MSEPQLRDLQCLDRRGLHRMAYWQWGDAANPKVLVCVHGLTPQGRDFDALARALCGEWQCYDRARCRTLLLRGAESNLMSAATAQAMTQRGPRAQLHEFAGVGHAPTLMQAEQIEVLRRFLLSP